MKNLPVFVLMMTVLFGCSASTTYTPTSTPPRAPQARAPESVELFTVAKPSRQYIEIGVFSSNYFGSAEGDTLREGLDALRIRAAQIGCDAVWVQHHAVSDGRPEIRYGSTPVLYGLQGGCLMYKE